MEWYTIFMLESSKKSPLDRLKKGLYSRNETSLDLQRHSIHAVDRVVSQDWIDEDKKESAIPASIHTSRKVYKIIFLASILFACIALVVTLYTFLGGKNFISADNVDILIEGPVSIGGGEVLSLQASVVNKNSTDIQLVDLIVEYPVGAKDSSDSTRDLSKVRLSLGDIKSQSVVQKTVSSILFGAEGSRYDIRFIAEYRTANSNAIFFKEKYFNILISSSPISVSINALKNVLGGQVGDTQITITSNTATLIKNLLLTVEYPFGFSVVGTNPKASYGDSVWRIGDLSPGAKRVISISGLLNGQNEESRTIKAYVGIGSQSNDREIATNIISKDHTFTIEKPFLGLDLVLNGNRKDAFVSAGDTVSGEVLWTNNSLSKITDTRIEVKLSGNAIDKNSVNVSDGYYDSLTNTIIWEAGRVSELDGIAPGADGRLVFSFRMIDTLDDIPQNPQVAVSVSGKGNRVDENGVPSNISSGITRSAKIISNVALSGRVLRSQGPISNSGPIPPKVDAVTTYTVLWTVTNTSNSIIGAKVTASLPPQVSWTDVVIPSDSGLTYNPTGGTISWSVGSLPRNATIGSGAKQVAFQVALRPSANQLGLTPEIMGPATITATDVFTGVTLQNSAPALSTRTVTDSAYRNGDELVVE